MSWVEHVSPSEFNDAIHLFLYYKNQPEKKKAVKNWKKSTFSLFFLKRGKPQNFYIQWGENGQKNVRISPNEWNSLKFGPIPIHHLIPIPLFCLKQRDKRCEVFRMVCVLWARQISDGIHVFWYRRAKCITESSEFRKKKMHFIPKFFWPTTNVILNLKYSLKPPPNL